MNDVPALPGGFDPKNLHCCDCGGYPLDEGAVFVAVFKITKGVPVIGGMCELCWLRRLERRGRMVNMSSSPSSQVEVPSLNLHRDKHGRPSR